MQRLPFVDEVREARRKATAAESAVTLLQQCGIALSAVSVVRRQVEAMDLGNIDLPGSDVVEQAIRDYPELAGLADIQPSPDQPIIRRLEQRRMQLRTVEAVIQPIAARAEDYQHQVHELQHRQSHMLQTPEYAELREGLNKCHETRRRSIVALSRLQTRRQSLLPSDRAVRDFLPQVKTELAAIDEGMNRMFARRRLITLVGTITQTARTLNLYTQLPDLAILEDDEGGDKVLHDTVRALEVLQQASVEEIATIDAEIAVVQAELDEATAWMLERTG